MSKSNTPAAAVLELWKRLQHCDPKGGWQSRNRLVDGRRRPSPLAHGFDLWSDVHKVFVVCKIKNRPITTADIEFWCDVAIAGDRPEGEHLFGCYVAYRQARSHYWYVAWFVSLFTNPLHGRILSITSLDSWLQYLYLEKDNG